MISCVPHGRYGPGRLCLGLRGLGVGIHAFLQGCMGMRGFVELCRGGSFGPSGVCRLEGDI